MTRFKYRSKLHPERGMIVIGQREDTSLFIDNAPFLEDEHNYFTSIEDIEEFIGDELEMIVRPS